MQRARLRSRNAGRLDLATANPAADAPLLHEHAVLLADDRRMLRRLLVRQSLQLRHRIRMEKLRIPSLDRHAGLFRSSPEARRPPFADLRKPVRDRSMPDGRDPDCNLQNTQLGQRGSRGPTVTYKNHETHPDYLDSVPTAVVD